jgi:hypothetical protein
MARPAHSPFHDGFAALWHEPALFLAELTWRWGFGLAAWSLTIISAAWFLDSLKLSSGDRFLLSTLQPHLLGGAVRHIFRGSLNRFLWEQTVQLLGLVLLWAFAATAGRAATIRRLVVMFGGEENSRTMSRELAPIFVLNLLRAAWTLIATTAGFVSLVGGFVLARNQRPLRAALLLALGTGLSWAFGVMLNWFFGLAPLFCVRNRVAASEALAQSVEFFSRQAGRLFGIGFVFTLLRLVWAGTMFFVVFAPLRLVHHVGRGWIALLMALVALLYFAGADLLYLARLGAYASLAEDESHPVEAPKELGQGEPPTLMDALPLMEPT